MRERARKHPEPSPDTGPSAIGAETALQRLPGSTGGASSPSANPSRARGPKPLPLIEVRRALALAREDAAANLDASIEEVRIARAKLWRIEARAVARLRSARACVVLDAAAEWEARVRDDAVGDGLEVMAEVRELLELPDRLRGLHEDPALPEKIERLEDEAKLLRGLFSFVASGEHRRGAGAAIAVEALPLYEAEAKERQRKAGEVHGRGQKLPAKMQEPISSSEDASLHSGEAAEHAARAVEAERLREIEAAGREAAEEERTCSGSEQVTPGKPGPSRKKGSVRDLSKRTGIPTTTIVKTREHMEAADTRPFSPCIPQRERLCRLPAGGSLTGAPRATTPQPGHEGVKV